MTRKSGNNFRFIFAAKKQVIFIRNLLFLLFLQIVSYLSAANLFLPRDLLSFWKR